MTSIAKGLAGVVVDTTGISKVVPETNSLIYRGYPVQDLVAHCGFEQVAYALWHGELPGERQLERFRLSERAARPVNRSLLSLVARMPDTCHPMDVVRTAISYLGAEDPAEHDAGAAAVRAAALKMLAVLPTVVAADLRRRRGLDPVSPDAGLGFAENFLYMCFGAVPDPELVAAFETSLILYAEHGFNASTFAARVVTSTESDVYSAVTAAIGALKGRLHGGANEAVMRDMIAVGEPEMAREWLRAKLSRKEKVMGFGHRVYRDGDSRVPAMRQALASVAAHTGGHKWVRMYDILEDEMRAATGIAPNLDFPTGPAYYLMGLDIPMFTPVFVLSRITGWTAHVIEQLESNALIRPLSHYTGVAQRAVLPA